MYWSPLTATLEARCVTDFVVAFPILPQANFGVNQKEANFGEQRNDGDFFALDSGSVLSFYGHPTPIWRQKPLPLWAGGSSLVAPMMHR